MAQIGMQTIHYYILMLYMGLIQSSNVRQVMVYLIGSELT